MQIIPRKSINVTNNRKRNKYIENNTNWCQFQPNLPSTVRWTENKVAGSCNVVVCVNFCCPSAEIHDRISRTYRAPSCTPLIRDSRYRLILWGLWKLNRSCCWHQRQIHSASVLWYCYLFAPGIYNMQHVRWRQQDASVCSLGCRRHLLAPHRRPTSENTRITHTRTTRAQFPHPLVP